MAGPAPIAARSGQPLRALGGLALALLLWGLWRLPVVMDRASRLMPQMADAAPRALQATASPQRVIARRAAPSPLPVRPLAPPLGRMFPTASAGPRITGTNGPALQELPPAVPPPVVGATQPPAPQPAVAAAAAPLAPPAADGARTAFVLASLAYERLAARQRRDAAALFDAALALQPDNRQWRADRRALGRRWQGEAFALVRESPANITNAPGSGLPGAAASPVLGGGQVGATLAFLPDPLARRPLAVVARAVAAVDPAGGLDQQSAQGALGVRLALLPGLSITAERLQPLAGGRGQFTLRLAGGGRAGRLDGYGEAGVLENGAVYAGAQATGRVLRVGPATLAAGAWGSVQTGPAMAASTAVWRVDVGPQVAVPLGRLRLAADWRQRVAGNAAPGSGPVLTVSAGF